MVAISSNLQAQALLAYCWASFVSMHCLGRPDSGHADHSSDMHAAEVTWAIKRPMQLHDPVCSLYLYTPL
jgi:hypothetical protein